MKKLKIAISLLLAVVICSFALVSCGSSSGSGGSGGGGSGSSPDEKLSIDDIIGQKVSQDEFKTAMTFVESPIYSFKSSETMEMNANGLIIKTKSNATGTYNYGNISGTRTTDTNSMGITQSETVDLDAEKVDIITAFYFYISEGALSMLYACLHDEHIEFDQFIYNYSTNAYEVVYTNSKTSNDIKETDDLHASVKIQNGHVAGMEITYIHTSSGTVSIGDSSFSSNSTTTMYGTYIFTDFE